MLVEGQQGRPTYLKGGRFRHASHASHARFKTVSTMVNERPGHQAKNSELVGPDLEVHSAEVQYVNLCM